MQKKVMALCLRKQFFLANPVEPENDNGKWKADKIEH